MHNRRWRTPSARSTAAAAAISLAGGCCGVGRTCRWRPAASRGICGAQRRRPMVVPGSGSLAGVFFSSGVRE